MLHEDRVGFGVAEHAEVVQHPQAELVGGGDGGRVDLGQRRLDALQPQRDLLGLGCRQVGIDRVVGQRAVRQVLRQGGAGLAQPGVDPMTQLAGGRPREGDHHDLLEPEVPLRQVAHGQGGDRIGLAGAGGGLQDAGAGGQRPQQVEGCQHIWKAVPNIIQALDDAGAEEHLEAG